jgi:hypothetical protein
MGPLVTVTVVHISVVTSATKHEFVLLKVASVRRFWSRSLDLVALFFKLY